jgi:hypothetical protein
MSRLELVGLGVKWRTVVQDFTTTSLRPAIVRILPRHHAVNETPRPRGSFTTHCVSGRHVRITTGSAKIVTAGGSATPVYLSTTAELVSYLGDSYTRVIGLTKTFGFNFRLQRHRKHIHGNRVRLLSGRHRQGQLVRELRAECTKCLCLLRHYSCHGHHSQVE